MLALRSSSCEEPRAVSNRGVSPWRAGHGLGAPIERKNNMIDLYKFFINPFDDVRISLNHLIDYGGTHLQRMVTNNPGALLNARITGTSTALSGLDNTMADNDTKLALRMARVHAKEAFRDALPGNIERIYGAVIAAFGSNATETIECFPQGRKPFLTSPDDQLDDKLQALQNCLTPFSAQVGVAHVNNLGGLISTWIALLAAVESASANKNSSESVRRAARVALQLELFKNVLALATAFPNDVAKATLYCPQHLLENAVTPPAEGEEAAA